MGACPSSASSTQRVECQQAYPKSYKFENALCRYPGMYCFYIATAHWIWLFSHWVNIWFLGSVNLTEHWQAWAADHQSPRDNCPEEQGTLLKGLFYSSWKQYAEDPRPYTVSNWKREDWHGRLQLCVYTTKILPSTISCSGFNQGLEISCTAHTGVDLLLLLPHLLLFPCQYKQQLRLAQTAPERSRFLSGGKATN